MNETNVIRKLVDLPDSMKFLPKDKRGYPVPKFVAWIDGEPDFRIVANGWFKRCVEENLCWLCGCKLGRKKWFVIGPMCCITHGTTEPPSHHLCAEFAAKNCPFLTKPLAKRREDGLPDDTYMVGAPILRNPGVVCIWETTSYRVMRVPGGYMIHVGPPENASFWREGRLATRIEVMDSVNSGMDILIDQAMKQDIADGLIVQKPATNELMKSAYYFGRLLDRVYRPIPANDEGEANDAS